MPFSAERINQLNEQRLGKICPAVAVKVRELISLARSEGYQLLVVQGLRTFAEQDALFAQGRTKKGKIVTNARGGSSWHNYGLAADFAFITNGEVDWTDALYRKIGGWAKASGLEWGGNWRTITDLPHVQFIDSLKISDALALYKKGGLPAVWHRVAPSAPPARPIPLESHSNPSDEAWAASPEAQPVYHTVKGGDTIWGISRVYGISEMELRKLNNINPKSSVIRLGQKLRVK